MAVSALDVITNVGTIDDLTSLARMLLVLPVAALDGIFILWVFTSLSRTLNQLQARKATGKLELYRCAAGVCAVAGMAGCMQLAIPRPTAFCCKQQLHVCGCKLESAASWLLESDVGSSGAAAGLKGPVAEPACLSAGDSQTRWQSWSG